MLPVSAARLAALVMNHTCPAAAPAFTSTSARARLTHHVVSFPDCRLHFDYPADLRPSDDFVLQRLATEVDYDRILWLAPTASSAFVMMRADVLESEMDAPAGTIAIDMWLCRPKAGFTGDLHQPEVLATAFAELCAEEGSTLLRADMQTVEIKRRAWVLVRDGGTVIAALNRTTLLAARVAIIGGADRSERWEQAFTRCRDIVLGSLRIEAVGSSVGSVES